MKPYYQDDRVTLNCGDALANLPQLPPDSVQTVITDPPYSSGGMVRGDRVASTQTKYVQTDSMSGKQLSSFSGDNRDQRGFTYGPTCGSRQPAKRSPRAPSSAASPTGGSCRS